MMDLLYQIFADVDILWVISIAIAILILDVFFLGTTALLLVSVALFVFAGLKLFIDDPVALTWSVPAILVVLFGIQRVLINASVSQKLPHQEKRSGTFKAVVQLAEDPESSSDYFYSYKDDKQAGSEDRKPDQKRYKASLPDGRFYLLGQNPKLYDGQRIKLSVSTDEITRIVKYYD
jgi:hypothetical protein